MKRKLNDSGKNAAQVFFLWAPPPLSPTPFLASPFIVVFLVVFFFELYVFRFLKVFRLFFLFVILSLLNIHIGTY